jgi:hypothetical protein
MPLLTKIYEQELLSDINKDIKSGLNDKLAKALQDAIESKKFQEELRIGLDGSDEWDGKETDAKDIDKALQNIKKRSKPLYEEQSAALAKGETPDEETINKKIREISANEWSNAISYNIVTWLNDLVVPEFSKVAAEVYADVFSDKLSKILSERTEEYLKTAQLTVLYPPGTITIGAGPAAIVNILPVELKLDPLLTLPDSLMLLKIPLLGGGGLK